MARVIIDPITRIEGHLSIEIDVEGGRVVDAKCRGDMFRGYEKILRGRNPVDANQITQRICGVCPVSHGIASSKCLESAFKITPNKNGRILRNLALAANYLHSHLIHFYHLAALDFVDITAVLKYEGWDSGLNNLKEWAKSELQGKKDRPDAITSVGPFLPRYGGIDGKGFYIKDVNINLDAIAGYVKALDIRTKAHKMVALLGGRVPHLVGLVPGGMTQVPTRKIVREYRSILKDVEKFINDVYIGHVIAVAKAFPDYFKIGKFNNFMSYGLFDLDEKNEKFMLQRGVYINGAVEKLDTSLIREQVAYSRYGSGSNLHPLKGETDPNPHKPGAYTWLKAPRYRGLGMEVGALARIFISYLAKN